MNNLLYINGLIPLKKMVEDVNFYWSREYDITQKSVEAELARIKDKADRLKRGEDFDGGDSNLEDLKLQSDAAVEANVQQSPMPDFSILRSKEIVQEEKNFTAIIKKWIVEKYPEKEKETVMEKIDNLQIHELIKTKVTLKASNESKPVEVSLLDLVNIYNMRNRFAVFIQTDKMQTETIATMTKTIFGKVKLHAKHISAFQLDESEKEKVAENQEKGNKEKEDDEYSTFQKGQRFWIIDAGINLISFVDASKTNANQQRDSRKIDGNEDNINFTFYTKRKTSDPA